MKDYSDFPSVKYFMRVLKNCPRSALLYLQLWENRGEYMGVIVNKKEIPRAYFISPTLFRNLLAPLMSLNVVHFSESEGKFQIDMMGTHVND